ncbi:MAG: CotS family spore coat protein [Clostridia bacterium]|nr:CotS family spore coat protein [Clostridia bacterium]
MEDRTSDFFDLYDFKVLRTYKGRGALICETDQGMMVLREYNGTQEKVALQDLIMNRIKTEDGIRVDHFIKNKEEGIISTDVRNQTYIVKKWYDGTECNILSLQDIEEATKVLSQIHQLLASEDLIYENQKKMPSIVNEFERKTRELKKIRSFVRGRAQKNEFDHLFLEYFDTFFSDAQDVMDQISGWNEEKFLSNVKESGQICHGNFTHHNVIKDQNGWIVINFEKYSFDTRIRDLCQFMRKVLEKNEWDIAFMEKMLYSYQKRSPLSAEETAYLYFRLAFPEKFWKIANYYYNTNKAWISEKNISKLKILITQNSAKRELVGKMRYL